jgi:hypothetical protein
MSTKKFVATAAFLTSLVSLTAAAQEGAAPGTTPTVAPAPTPVAADASSETKMMIGADAAFMLPLGNWGDATGVGFGALARFEYKLQPKLNLTGRVGYIYSLSKHSMSMSVIPIWAGAKYFLTDMFYGGAEIGFNDLMASTTVAGRSYSGSDTKLGLNVGAGAIVNGVDLRAQLAFLSIGDTTDAMALILTAGYNFKSF